MNPFAYLRKKGFVGTIQVIWRYKLPKLQVALLSRLTREMPLKNKIVIESHDDFDCNGGALYNYLIEHGYNKRIKIVWRLYHPLDTVLPDNVEVVPLYGPSWRKAWHVCTAKWFTADCTVVDRVRDDQISLYMTHGIFGLKNFKGLADTPPSVTDYLSPSCRMDEILSDMKGMTGGQIRMLHLGFPVLDRLYANEYSKGYLRQEDSRPMFLWMPTFRKGIVSGRTDAEGEYPYGVALIDDSNTLEGLATHLRRNNARMVIKLHPKEDLSILARNSLVGVSDVITMIAGDMMSGADADNHDLMLDSIALITDYSGIVFEYLALDRPVAFDLSDIKRYKIGLIPNSDRYMPGQKIDDYSGLCDFIEDVCRGNDAYAQDRRSFCSWFFDHEDSSASERIVDYLGMNDL